MKKVLSKTCDFILSHQSSAVRLIAIVLLFITFNSLFLTSTKAVGETELLQLPWKLSGNNGAAEKYQAIPANSLIGKDTIRLTYNLHGTCILGGDASAIIFDQNGWRYISLSNYGKNCFDGNQTVDIPLSKFSGMDLTKPVGTFHSRFWLNNQFNIDIISAQVFSASTTMPNPSPSATPIPLPVNNAYSGQYFSNRTLSGTPTFTRNDSEINFTWNHLGPVNNFPVDNFSVRWTKVVNLNAGTYRFTTTADDGVRVFVDGVKVIDGWKDQGATTYTKDVSLGTDNHNLVVEYYENGGGSVMRFSYNQISTATSTPAPSVIPTPTPIPTPVPTNNPGVGSWAIQSVSSMKESKDRICSPRDAAWIGRWVDKAKELGANYVAVETPYENPSCGNATAYTKVWVDIIRSRGLKVWHRHMPLAFEGIYSVNKTKGDYLNTISSYIRNNPGLFAEGDIFTPIPEPQNGGISGITHCAFGVCQFDNAPMFNKWLRDAIDTSESAFGTVGLGRKIKIGYYGFDGFVAWGANNPDWNGIIEDATIAKMGNLTIDHYPELIGTSMKTDLDELQAMYPNVPIIFGEWGSTGSTNLEQQVINSMGAAKRPNIVGFNYWHMGMGGNEALINDDFTNRAQFDEVQSFFKGTR